MTVPVGRIVAGPSQPDSASGYRSHLGPRR